MVHSANVGGIMHHHHHRTFIIHGHRLFITQALLTTAGHQVEVLGSYRRGAASSGDVDCLITHPRHTQRSGDQYSYVPRLVRSLQRQGFLVDDLVSGPAKYMGVCTTGAPGAQTHQS